MDLLRCVQLAAHDLINEVQYSEIARLIYDTDPFIYPAFFENKNNGLENAAQILPAVFESNCDPMFSKDNLFVAMDSDKVVGLILWHKGSLEWTPDAIIATAAQKRIALNKSNVEQVSKEYISSCYETTGAREGQKLHLINVCVSRKMRGQGIAGFMMDRFIKEHLGEKMELVVLADNLPAIQLYTKYGFRIVQECDGFSLTDNKPLCFFMVRQ